MPSVALASPARTAQRPATEQLLVNVGPELAGAGRTVVADMEGALALLESRAFETLYVDCRGLLASPPLRDFLQTCRERFPGMQRVLVCDVFELTDIFRDWLHASADRIVPREAMPGLLDRGPGSEPVSSAAPELSQLPANDTELLEWTVRRALSIPGAVVRPSAASPGQLQLVLPPGSPLDAFKRELERAWGVPVKREGVREVREGWRRHPAVKKLGRFAPEQALFIQADGPEANAHLSLCLLPWLGSERITVVLDGADALGAPLHARMENLRRFAMRHLPELVIPELLRGSERPKLGFLPEYDWVFTPSYVGPDRRRRRTPFWNLYSVHGRRMHLVETGVWPDFHGFVDRPPNWVLVLQALGLLLCIIDAGFTDWLVRAGRVSEANPLIREVLTFSPPLFWLLKTAGTLFALFIMGRCHTLKRWRYLLPGLVGVYVALTAYWLTIAV